MRTQSWGCTPALKPPPKSFLPLLHLQKDKKYLHCQKENSNPLKMDLDNVISSLTSKEQSYHYIQAQKQRKIVNKKISDSALKISKGRQSIPHPLLLNQVKTLKNDLKKYIDKLGQPQEFGQGDYPQFIKLSRESQDYLEYYLKNHFKITDLNAVQCADKSIILSQLKNNYPCLTDNPPQISSRILLGLDVNPLNDFHLVPWNSFNKLRKLSTLRHTKNEGRKFMVSYLLAKGKKLRKQEFWAIVSTLLRKLQLVVNQNNIEKLIERIKEYADEWVPEEMDSAGLHHLLISNNFFLWEELIQVMFLV